MQVQRPRGLKQIKSIKTSTRSWSTTHEMHRIVFRFSCKFHSKVLGSGKVVACLIPNSVRKISKGSARGVARKGFIYPNMNINPSLSIKFVCINFVFVSVGNPENVKNHEQKKPGEVKEWRHVASNSSQSFHLLSFSFVTCETFRCTYKEKSKKIFKGRKVFTSVYLWWSRFRCWSFSVFSS